MMNIQVIDLTHPLWKQTLEKLNHDIYHLPEYMYLESKRIKAIPEAILITEDEKVFFLPYMQRCGDDLFNCAFKTPEIFDVVSPYGYPGFLLSEAAASQPEFLSLAMQALVQVFRDKQVCSAFLRLHPLLNENVNQLLDDRSLKVNGSTVSIDLRLDAREIWHQTRSEHRNKINKCKRLGLTARMVSAKEFMNEFNTLYEETMNRVNARDDYYFGIEFLREFAELLGDKVHIGIVEYNEQIASAGLFTECCGIVQYHLGGTKTDFLKPAPSKLMFDYVRFWAKERGNHVFHLGGGVGGAKDSLYHFKAGFSKQSHAFMTLRLITDQEKYRSLVELRAKSLKIDVEKILQTEFFPAYRSPNIFNES
ncbi:GNAT family N-acetyltransferase [Scytonema sp. NUACC26]|uniref:GNAT family N-acetyltransferase n=1 Tax=Scytonema sp. NUACC26 TaxID=3140176 RepID=UPI0038B27B5D